MPGPGAAPGDAFRQPRDRGRIDRDLWYGSPVRLLLVLSLALASVGCKAPLIQNLPLQWTGVKVPAKPIPTVSQALASVPISFAVCDVRPDPTVVGTDVSTDHIVRTTDDVAQFTSTYMGELLRAAGARFEAPAAVIETDLTEFNVDEAGGFNGAVGIRVTVRRGGQAPWTKGFRGTAKTWGKSHNPGNFNKVLSVAIYNATEQLLQDEGFAAALTGSAQPVAPPGPPLPPPPPGAPAPVPPPAQ